MINGVTFGILHSYEDLELILTSKTIGAPVPKTGQVDIPGADGQLDYTEYFGDIKYKNRTLSFEFSTIAEPSNFLMLYSYLQNALNGRRMDIILDDDPMFHYSGRVYVNEWKSNKRIGKIVIDVDADPYKLRNAQTLISHRNITDATVINCRNSRRQVIPKITASAEVVVVFGNYSKTFTGSITDDNIIFTEGQNVLTVTPTSGSATILIEYQEGEL